MPEENNTDKLSAGLDFVWSSQQGIGYLIA